MFRLVATATAAVAVLGVTSTTVQAKPKPGGACSKVDKTTKSGAVDLKCVKTKAGKKVWRRVKTPAPAPAPTPVPTPTPSAGGGAGIIPSGSWECGIGTYPYTSYQKLVTSGSSYTVSNTDGTGASSGTYGPGTHAPLNGGTPIKFTGGAWNGFKGEYVTAGTKTAPSLPPLTVNMVYVDGGLNNNYYPGSCSPK